MATLPRYLGDDPSSWPKVTRDLLHLFPLSPEALVAATIGAWDAIFDSQIGGHQIGVDIKPVPQIMSFFLHELIPLRLGDEHGGDWRIGQGKEKDVVYEPDGDFSFEIKASSHPTDIFGNRSYAQPPNEQKARTGKVKDGFYVAVNFQKFAARDKPPQLVRIRFGWLEHADWVAQTAPTGQQAHLRPGVADGKLVELWPNR